jgi:RNA recognition motif-containing protein
VPLNNKNNQNRGFAFVEFSEKSDAEAAVKEMHGTMFKGRPLTVEFALSKASYEAKIDHVVANTKMDRDAVIKSKMTPKEKKEEKKEAKEGDEEMPEAKAEEKKVEEKKVEEPKEKKVFVKKEPAKRKDGEAPEQATLFVRNIGWNTTQDMFSEHMAKFGQIKYAVLCRAQGDKESGADAHRGTGFVRFVHKVDADALVELSQKVESELDTEWKKKNANAMNKNK